MSKRLLFFTIMLSLVGGLLLGVVHAQDATPTPTEQPVQASVGGPAELDTTAGLPQAFTAYTCTFNRNDNRAQIQAIFMDANGRPVPRGDYRTITVTQTDTGELVSNRDVVITPIATRPPLRMIIVLDITASVPLLEVKQALVDSLIPNLLPQDEIALITFGATISDLTPFFSDKNRLINEFVLDLERETSNARVFVYNALLESVRTLENFSSGERRTILMLTDSGQRVDEQATVNEIIERSQLAGIQIYPIGFYSGTNTTDSRPDVDILKQIAYQTNGFGWFYEAEEITRAGIQSSVSGFLVDFTQALNSELQVDVLTPVPSTQISGLAQYRLAVVQNAADGFETTVNCPVDELNHNIIFAGTARSYITPDPVTVEVNVETDLNPDAVRVRFFVDNEAVQTTTSRTFTFESARATPGQHTIMAQLLDRNDTVLATTIENITVYAQQVVDVAITSGSYDRLDLPINLRITIGEGINLENVQANLYEPDSNEPRPVGSGNIEQGVANIFIQNLQLEIESLKPTAANNDVFLLLIEVPGLSPSDPPFAAPYPIDVTYRAPEVIALIEAEERPLPGWVRLANNIRYEPYVMPTLIAFGLLLLNYLLYLRVMRLRVQKVISRPDSTELGETLMAVTVRSAGENKTYSLTKKTQFVGRGDTNDIELGTSEKISRRHGVIMWRKGRWWYTNRKPDVWAIVEGKRVRDMRIIGLEPITEIDFGDSVMIFHFGTQDNIDALFNTDLGGKK
jgi:hypothetical protein